MTPMSKAQMISGVIFVLSVDSIVISIEVRAEMFACDGVRNLS